MTQRLFKFRLRHQYYANGIIPDARIQPDAPTLDLLSRLQISIYHSKSSIELFYFGPHSRRQLLDSLANSGVDDFRFSVFGGKELFYSITEVPQKYVGQFFLYSVASAQGTNMRLAAEFSSRKYVPFEALGQVAISIVDIASNLSVHVEPEFEFEFQARNTSWQYYIFNRSQRELINPRVVDNQGYQMTGPEPVTVGRQHGLLFHSGSKSFPLSEYATTTFSLQDSTSGTLLHADQRQARSKTLVSVLPIPDAFNLHICPEQRREVGCSQMYVYL